MSLADKLELLHSRIDAITNRTTILSLALEGAPLRRKEVHSDLFAITAESISYDLGTLSDDIEKLAREAREEEGEDEDEEAAE